MKNKDKPKRWTFVVIGNNRQLRSFDITEAFVIIFLLAVLSLASVAIATYLLHDKKQDLALEDISNKLENTQFLLSAANQENSELAANIKTLEDRLTTAVKQTSNTIKKTPSSPPPSKKEESIINIVEEEVPPLPEAANVDVSDFTIRHRDKNFISYSFIIKNAATDNAPVSGYTFAILRSDSAEQSLWISNPKTTLVNGIPQYFKKGEYFSINRYKTTRGRFENLSEPNSLDTISILVFSNNGKLILKRDYKI